MFFCLDPISLLHLAFPELLTSNTFYFSIDIRECDEDPLLCGGGLVADCRNIEGSFECICHNGYVLDPESGKCVGMY